MRETEPLFLRRAARSAPGAMLIMLLAGCGEPPTTPTPTPVPAASPFPAAPGLNAVFLTAPVTPPRDFPRSLVGRYQLEIDAAARSGDRCSSVPDHATRRSYTADIVHLGDRYAVKLYDAAFLADTAIVSYGCRDPRLPQGGNAACHQLLLTGDAGALALTADAADEWRGSEVWEALPEKFVVAMTGHASGAVRGGQIEATGTGALWYGNGLPASIFYSCTVSTLRYTFTPR